MNACKARLVQAIKAAEDLESHVRWLVKERAWLTLGYANLAEMWEAHSGYKCPSMVVALGTIYLRESGETVTGTADMVGLPVYSVTKADRPTPARQSPHVRNIMRQHEHGVPAREISVGADHYTVGNRIHAHGVRARGVPRRLAAQDNDLVSASVLVPKRDDDSVADIARRADVPKAEIYRQAVAEYLMRHRESRPDES